REDAVTGDVQEGVILAAHRAQVAVGEQAVAQGACCGTETVGYGYATFGEVLEHAVRDQQIGDVVEIVVHAAARVAPGTKQRPVTCEGEAVNGDVVAGNQEQVIRRRGGPGGHHDRFVGGNQRQAARTHVAELRAAHGQGAVHVNQLDERADINFKRVVVVGRIPTTLDAAATLGHEHAGRRNAYETARGGVN